MPSDKCNSCSSSTEYCKKEKCNHCSTTDCFEFDSYHCEDCTLTSCSCRTNCTDTTSQEQCCSKHSKKCCATSKCCDHCETNSSSSSSSSNDSCCDRKCKNLCKPKKCPCYNAKEIYSLFKNAVVSIKAISGLTVQDIGLGEFCTSYTKYSSGFFIDGSFIVTAASAITVKKGDIIKVQNPTVVATEEIEVIVIDHIAPNTDSIRAERIFAQVYDPTKNGLSYIYEAEIVAIDLAGDIALLKIDPCLEFNRCNPCLNCQPHFQFSDSACLCIGSTVFVIGNANNEDDQAIIEALVRDNKGVDKSGKLIQQLIILDTDLPPNLEGAPIIDTQGCVVGFITFSSITRDVSGGVNERFIRPVLKELFKAEILCNKNYDQYLEYVGDRSGPFLRYVKGFIGIRYRVADASDFIQPPQRVEGSVCFEEENLTIESSTESCLDNGKNKCHDKNRDCHPEICPPSSTTTGSQENCEEKCKTDFFQCEKNCNEQDRENCLKKALVCASTQIPVPVLPTCAEAIQFRKLENLCFLKAGVVGIIITGFFQDRNVTVFPKNCPQVCNDNDCYDPCCKSHCGKKSESSSTSTSTSIQNIIPEIYCLKINDVITHLNGHPLGTLANQIPPSLVTWCLTPQKCPEFDSNKGCGSEDSKSSKDCCKEKRPIPKRPIYVTVTYRRYCDINECTNEQQPYFNEFQGLLKLHRYPFAILNGSGDPEVIIDYPGSRFV